MLTFIDNKTGLSGQGFTGLLPLQGDGVNHQETPESLLFFMAIISSIFKALNGNGLLKFTGKFTKAGLLGFCQKVYTFFR